MFTTQCSPLPERTWFHTPMVGASVDNQLTEIGSEPQIMSAYEAKNLRVAFPNESQPIGGSYCVGNGVDREAIISQLLTLTLTLTAQRSLSEPRP